MWNLVDERRKINASISHDLRTPITVIKGYSEYLDKNTGKGTLTEDGTREIAVYIHQAASRLEEYADSVHEIQALEAMRLEYQEVKRLQKGNVYFNFFFTVSQGIRNNIFCDTEYRCRRKNDSLLWKL